ncbi:MAG: hypothetical protein ACLFS9_07345, partial [Nitriliruptoraceae bacterium]
MFALVALTLSLTPTAGCDGPDDPTDAGGAASDAGFDGGGAGREACGPDGGPRDAGLATGLTNLCRDGLVMSGFGLRWADDARNVARLGIHPA